MHIFFQFCRTINIFLLLVSMNSNTAKYAEDSEEVSVKEGDAPVKPKPKLSEASYEDDDVNQGNEDEEELPDGFEVLDGVVLDTTNIIIQEAAGEWTQYKMYEPATQDKGEVLYKRPRREAGWHFIMFEDPMELSGLGHLVLLQKLLGFSIDSNKFSSNKKELRLYETFHVDLGNDFVEEDEIDDDNEASEETKIQKEDPNDSADVEPVMKGEPELNEDEKNAIAKIDETLNSNNEDSTTTGPVQENEDKSVQDTPLDTDAKNIDPDKQEEMDEEIVK